MKESKKAIFLVYSCNAHKCHSSEKLIMATTSVRKLKSFLAKEIAKGNMDYHNNISNTPKRMSEIFKKDFDVLTRREINDRLVYGYFDYCYDGEEI